MPLSVINSMQVDHVVSLTEMGALLEEITRIPPDTQTQAPKDVALEAEIFEKMLTDIPTASEYGSPSVYTFPDCGGVLFQHTDDAILKFKCHTGHSYTVRDLVKKQTEEVEDSLWYAIRSLEQRRNLMQTLMERYTRTGNQFMATDYQKRMGEIITHIENLKKIIMANMDASEDT